MTVLQWWIRSRFVVDRQDIFGIPRQLGPTAAMKCSGSLLILRCIDKIRSVRAINSGIQCSQIVKTSINYGCLSNIVIVFYFSILLYHGKQSYTCEAKSTRTAKLYRIMEAHLKPNT